VLDLPVGLPGRFPLHLPTLPLGLGIAAGAVRRGLVMDLVEEFLIQFFDLDCLFHPTANIKPNHQSRQQWSVHQHDAFAQ
jgi:hypothetical protein